MSSGTTPSNPTPPSADLFERLADRQVNVAYVLFGLAAALAAIPIVNLSLYKWESLAVFLWGAALTVFVLAVALWQMTTVVAGDRRDRADRLRITVILVLGGVGLLTALLGLLLPFSSSPFTMIDYREIFSSGVRKWRERENAWALARCAAAILGGLVLMFIGLIQARNFERTSPNLRRLLYGYNAILTSILLILIMGLINLLPYSGVQPFSYANESIDWTRSGIHTLHAATKNVLAELKQPVKVYALGARGDRVAFEMTALLEKCRAINPQQLDWEQLSRDRDPEAMLKLMRKYQVPESEGVLVVYGTDPNTIHDFIKRGDLFEEKRFGEPSQRFVFKGENALLNSLTFLASGKKKAVVYFTQGNGELAFNDRQMDLDAGMGVLIDDLNRINFDARELTVKADTDKIPEDADIVVIARPRDEYPANFVTALRDYLKGAKRKDNKKGKLFVLFDVIQRGGKGPMVRTGLEQLMMEQGVRVGDNRVLNLFSEDPLEFTVVANEKSKNPVARSFTSQEGQLLFYLYKARTVEPARTPPPGAAAAETAQSLMTTRPTYPFLIDTNLDASPTGVIRELARLGPQKVNERLSQTPLPLSLAVTVSEGQAPPPVPGHDFMAREGKPHLVVFGDASWISNKRLQRVAPNHLNLFSSCLSWLAERADIGVRVPPTQHDLYRIQAPPSSTLRLVLLPGFLMMLGVFGLGIGVWVVRRR